MSESKLEFNKIVPVSGFLPAMWNDNSKKDKFNHLNYLIEIIKVKQSCEVILNRLFSLFQSLWNKFFQDKELRLMIEQDVTRTYVELFINYFQ